MTDDHRPVVDALLDTFGGSLFGVGEFDGDNYELLYITDDAEADYPEKLLDQIRSDLVLETLRKRSLEEQFPTGGEYRYTAIGFEEMTVFLFLRSPAQGLVVSIGSDYFDDVDDVYEVCQPFL